jgi:chemotaxis receptor (MCP) glutamine deamidase CheD
MFYMPYPSDPGVGEQNITAIKKILKHENIPVVGEDTGGHTGRSVKFHLDLGRLVVLKSGEKSRSI